MYALLQTTRSVPTGSDIVSGHPEPVTLVALEQLGIGWRTTVTLWHTHESAEQVAADAPGDIYEVEEDWPGAAAGERPEVASLLYFDGPLSAARLEAARWSSRERILPATRDLPGRVRTTVLFDPEEAKVAVLTLATSMPALEAIGQAVMGTELLPGEDPALLTGPDRVEICRVVGYATEPVPL